jgi:site-specific recombinase XerD
MNSIHDAVKEYLQLRRNLGYQLRVPGRLLHSFAVFAEREKATHITTDLLLRWAQQPANARAATWAGRFQTVRRFALWLSTSDRRTEVPPACLLPYRYERKRPYIYSEADIANLVRTAGQLPSPTGRKGHTFATIFGLLAVAGMRISEALALDREDVNLEEGILRIRRSKFGKSRLVAVHESTRQFLAAYAQARDRVVQRPATAAFFLSEKGSRVTEWAARYNFAKVSREVGLRTPTTNCRHGCGPRLHDLRHRFATCTLLNWYRAGIDAEREIPKLATYLGHVHVNETYWYLEAVPELLEQATRRLEGQKEATP